MSAFASVRVHFSATCKPSRRKSERFLRRIHDYRPLSRNRRSVIQTNSLFLPRPFLFSGQPCAPILFSHQCVNSNPSRGCDRNRPYIHYSNTSSICSMTSSTHTSISSLASLTSCLSVLCPRSSANSRLRNVRQAFHSSTRRFRKATSSALTLLSSAASSSSNTRLYSRRFLLIVLCCSFVSRVGGLGRQINCLKRSWICFVSSCPRKSQTA